MLIYYAICFISFTWWLYLFIFSTFFNVSLFSDSAADSNEEEEEEEEDEDDGSEEEYSDSEEEESIGLDYLQKNQIDVSILAFE